MNDFQSTINQINILLNPEDCIHVNINMIQDYGLKNAIYFAYLADCYKHCLDYDCHKGWISFPLMKDQNTETGMSTSTIRNCKKYLVDRKVIKIKFKGNPPRQCFKINPQYLPW